MAISPTESISSVTASSTLSPSLPRGSEGFQKSLIGQNATLEKPVTNPPSQPAAKPDTRPNPTRSHIERNVTHKTGGLHQRRLQAVNSAAGGFMSYGQFMVEMGLKTSLVAGENAKTDLRGTMLSNELMQSLSPRAQQYLIQEKTTGSIRESARHVYSPITGANGPESHYKVIIQAIRVAKHMTHEDMLQGSNINPPGQNIGESLRPHYPGAGERVSGGLTTEQRYPGIGSLTHTEAYRELTINNQTVWIRPPSHNGTADTVAPNYSVMYREASGKVQEQILGGSGSWEGAARLAKAFLGAGADTAKTSTATTKPDTAPVPQAVQVAPKSTLNQVIDEAVSTVPQAQQSSVTQALRETFKQNNITRPQQAQSYISQLTPGSETLGQLTQKAHQIEAQAQTPMNPGSRNTAVPIMQDGKPIGAIPGKPGEIIQFAKASKTAADEIQIHAPGDTPGKRPADLYDEKTPFSTTLPEAKPTGDAQPTDALANPNTLEAKPIGDGNLLRPTGNGQAAEIDLGHARPEFMPTNGQSHVKTGQALQSTVNIGSPEEALPQRAPVELTPVIKAPKAGTPNTVVASQSGAEGADQSGESNAQPWKPTQQDLVDRVIVMPKDKNSNVDYAKAIREKPRSFDTRNIVHAGFLKANTYQEPDAPLSSQEKVLSNILNEAHQAYPQVPVADLMQQITKFMLTGMPPDHFTPEAFADINNVERSRDFVQTVENQRMSGGRVDMRRHGHSRLDLNLIDLHDANLKRVFLPDAALQSSNLSGANLELAVLDGSDLSGADLQGANLRSAMLSRADLSNANLQSTDLRGADLKEAILTNTLLGQARLAGANLSGSDLRGQNLQGVNLRGANLEGTDLRGVNLQGADLRKAQLGSANLEGANLRGAKLVSANLVNANLRGANLQNADLYDANLTAAKLQSASLVSADLQNAALGRAELTDAVLTNANLRSTDLNNTDLSGRNLASLMLRNVNFSGANLNGANLASADLQGAVLRGASLEGAVLKGAMLSSINAMGANLSGANLENAVITQANFNNALLSGANLSRVQLNNNIGSWLGAFTDVLKPNTAASFNGADLSGADLRDADLQQADLQNANLWGAIVNGANLLGANLKDAVYDLGILVNTAKTDDTTQF